MKEPAIHTPDTPTMPTANIFVFVFHFIAVVFLLFTILNRTYESIVTPGTLAHRTLIIIGRYEIYMFKGIRRVTRPWLHGLYARCSRTRCVWFGALLIVGAWMCSMNTAQNRCLRPTPTIKDVDAALDPNTRILEDYLTDLQAFAPATLTFAAGLLVEVFRALGFSLLTSTWRGHGRGTIGAIYETLVSIIRYIQPLAILCIRKVSCFVHTVSSFARDVYLHPYRNWFLYFGEFVLTVCCASLRFGWENVLKVLLAVYLCGPFVFVGYCMILGFGRENGLVPNQNNKSEKNREKNNENDRNSDKDKKTEKNSDKDNKTEGDNKDTKKKEVLLTSAPRLQSLAPNTRVLASHDSNRNWSNEHGNLSPRSERLFTLGIGDCVSALTPAFTLTSITTSPNSSRGGVLTPTSSPAFSTQKNRKITPTSATGTSTFSGDEEVEYTPDTSDISDTDTSGALFTPNISETSDTSDTDSSSGVVLTPTLDTSDTDTSGVVHTPDTSDTNANVRNFRYRLFLSPEPRISRH